MGKDREGNFHPGKGKPSGVNKSEPLDKRSDRIDEDVDIRNTADAMEKYSEALPIRHRNRNTSKGNDFKAKENRSESNKSLHETATEDLAPATTPEELPGILNKEIVSELANHSADPSITIYLRTHAYGMEVNEKFDTIAFKNALQKATELLKKKGIDEGIIKRILEPGYDILRNDAFWKRLSPGLAFFMADGFCRYIKMPVQPDEDVLINTSFFISQLTGILTNPEYFYLLVISKKQAKLFRADAFGMEFVPVERLSRLSGEGGTVEGGENASVEKPESQVQATGVSIYGSGERTTDNKTNIALYLENADDILWDEVLHKENAPLLLAGVEYLIPIYRSVCDYHNVWPDALTGSYEHSDTATLYQQAKAVMQPYFGQRLSKAITNFGNQSATSLTSTSPTEIIPSAYYSRVSHLFVRKNTHIWGVFDEANNELHVHDAYQDGDDDMIEKAVLKTILTGGEVFMLDPLEMPAQSELAAILRY